MYIEIRQDFSDGLIRTISSLNLFDCRVPLCHNLCQQEMYIFLQEKGADLARFLRVTVE